MLHKVYDFFGWKREPTLGELEKENLEAHERIYEKVTNLVEENERLMAENEKLKGEKNIPPLKITLRSTRKRRPWCWGFIMMFMTLVQAILVASGKQRTARRHMIACLKEIEYHYGFRFLSIEEGEEPDERKG